MNPRLTLITVVMSAGVLASGAANAQSDLLDGWSGSASLGALFTAGNSDTQNVSGSASVAKQVDIWRHTAFGSTYKAENNDEESANRFDLGYKIDRQISDVLYTFGRLRYDSDDYGNIDGRFSGVVGVGRPFIDDGKQTLTGELGIGAYSADYLSLTPVLNNDPTDIDPDTGLPYLFDSNQEPLDSLSDSGFTLYGGIKYSNILNENTKLNSVLNFEAADNNTYTVWDNSLNFKMSDSISLSLGLLFRNNTDIVGPRGENTDTATRIGIVFGI